MSCYMEGQIRTLGQLGVPASAVRAVQLAIASSRMTWCPRCHRRSDRWPAGEDCCTRFGSYRGRHRKAARS